MSEKAFVRHLTTPTPQTEQLSADQVKNNAGGYVFRASDVNQLRRFLILGVSGGTYYQKEAALTKSNLTFLKDLILSNEELVWDTVKAVAEENSAFKVDPAIFALAYLFKYGKVKDTPWSRPDKTAKTLFPYVIRIGTHLYQLKNYLKLMGVSGRQSRRAFSSWYVDKPLDAVAYQVVKYRNRHGWTHGDIFRTVHPTGFDSVLGSFVLGHDDSEQHIAADERPELNIVRAFLAIQKASEPSEVLDILDQPFAKNLPWEGLPTSVLKDPAIWKRLFYNGQLRGQALIRNVTHLAEIGAFDDMVFALDYADKLSDEESIRRTRLHPLNYLNALTVYTNGRVWRPKLNSRKSIPAGYNYQTKRVKTWSTAPIIVDALNKGFYASFKYLEPTGKRYSLNLDVSDSMKQYHTSGLDLSCAQVGAAMLLAIANSERYYTIQGFSSASEDRWYSESVMRDLDISPGMRMDDVLQKTDAMTFGSTDCSLPIEDAIAGGKLVDVFIILTDNETYQGERHVPVALADYRRRFNPKAKTIIVSMTATPFSIADPKDPGMLDVVGADSNLPKLIAEFSKDGV